MVVCESVPTRVSGNATRPVSSSSVGDDGGQELEIDLVDDPGSRGHDPQVPERRLRPAQELVPLTVALVLALDVEGEGTGTAPGVDLDRVVDDEVRGDQRVHPRGVAAQVRHRVAHHGEVHDRRNAGEVLEHDPAGHERDLGLAGPSGAPAGERRNVVLADDATARMAERVLEQDLEGHRRQGKVHAQVEAGRAERGQPVVIGEAGAEGGARAECVGRGHVLNLH